jgi:hypothetical protein
MTIQREQELRSQVTKELGSLFNTNNFKSACRIFVHLGKDYLRILEGGTIFPPKSTVKIARGTPGKKLSDLYTWLYGEAVLPTKSLGSKRSSNGIHIRGAKISLKKEEVLNVARQAIKNGAENQACPHSWFVLIDDVRVSPKWLVSLLTNLPVSSFHSDDARRVMLHIGLEVMRL